MENLIEISGFLFFLLKYVCIIEKEIIILHYQNKI